MVRGGGIRQRLQRLVLGTTGTVLTGTVSYLVLKGMDLVHLLNVEPHDLSLHVTRQDVRDSLVDLSLRDNFSAFLTFMGHLSYQCDKLLGDDELTRFLQRERYDIAVLDAFNPCSFILAQKLGIYCGYVIYMKSIA